MKTLSRNIFAIIALTLCCQSLFAQGGQLAPGVDLNADGQAELLSASGSSGTVTVLDGATHAAIRIIAAPVADSGFGSAVTWLPDVNNDGLSDLAVLAPWTTTSTSWGTVYIYSLATGALLSTADAPTTRHLGVIMKLVADQDSDSIPDLLVELQATGTQSKSVLVSSRTGTILTELPGTVAEMLNYVAQGGKLYAQSDIDGSGSVDLLDVAGFTGLVTAEDPRADLNHDGVIDTDDTLVMIGDSSQGIVTIAAQGFVSTGGAPPENCLCTIAPANNTSPCAGVSVSVTFPSGIRVGEPFLLTVTGVPADGSICAEIVQGNGLILNASQSPISMVLFDSESVCVRVKYTVVVDGETCSKCTTVCMAAELICPLYTISLRCPTFSDPCPVMVSANALNTVFAVTNPEGAAVYWVIDDPQGFVEWYREYPTQLKFRTKNLPGTFTVRARYGPENGPCPAGYADCVITIDPDTDGDGLSDFWENMPGHCTDPNERDSDGDGVWDGAEITMGTDPCLASSTPAMVDSDNDGLTDIEEYQTYHTDPHLFDTDGDNVQDYAEVELARLGVMPHMDPLQAYSLSAGNTSLPHAFDGWQACYYLVYDKDRDGLFDPWELAMGLDATQVDQDGDEIGDGLEMRPRPLPPSAWGGGPTNVSARSVFFAEDGVRGGESGADGDWDGLSDVQEEWLGTSKFNADSDGDGVLDGDESRLGLNPSRASSWGDYTSDGAGDIDGDGLANGNEYNNGGLIDDADTDGDGVSDGVEVGQGSMADSDADGGRPRTELDLENEFVEVFVEVWAVPSCEFSVNYTDGSYQRGHFTGGSVVARAGPSTVRVFGKFSFSSNDYAFCRRSVLLKRGVKHNFTTSTNVAHNSYSNHDMLPQPHGCDWTEISIGGWARIEGGGVFAPKNAAAAGVPRNSLRNGRFDSLEISLPGDFPIELYGQPEHWELHDSCDPSRNFSGMGDPRTYRGDIYVPKIKFYDLRDWSPKLTRLEDQVPPETWDSDDIYGIRFVKLDRTTADSFEGLQEIQGAVTDGVSAVVCRLDPWPNIANNESLDLGTAVKGGSLNLENDPALGRTASWPGAENIFFNEMPWGTVSHDGVFLYIPPDRFADQDHSVGNNFGRGEICDILIKIPDLTSEKLRLRRPPILLVHGIMSSGATWDASIWNNTELRTSVYRMDYNKTSHQGYWENAKWLPQNIDTILGEYRSGSVDGKRYAATQIDMVGHSQGGQLIRWYMADTHRFDVFNFGAVVERGLGWNGYPVITARKFEAQLNGVAVINRQNKRADNYFCGDVHRFIAIGSPFDGSPLANMVAPLVSAKYKVVFIGMSMRGELPPDIESKFFPNINGPLEGRYTPYAAPTAAADLQQDRISAPPNLPPVFTTSYARQVLEHSSYSVGPGVTPQQSVPWMPFIGVASNPDPTSPIEHTAWDMLTTIVPVDVILPRNANYEVALLPTISDLIVESASQRNAMGVNGSPLSTLGPTPFNFTAHVPVGPLFGETSNPLISIEARRHFSVPKSYLHIGDLWR